jgi:hypothetical protein
MTVSITSSLRIGIVAGTGATISGPSVPAITTDDIFDALSPTQTLTDVIGGISAAKLLGTANIDGTVAGNYPIYTVPAGYSVIPTALVFVLTHIAGSGTSPAINVGYTGSFRELIDSVRNTTYTLNSTSALAAAGTGYSGTNVLSLVGGTHSSTATITVDTVNTGAVATFHVSAIGSYTVLPSNPVSVTGGGGSGFTLTAVWDTVSTLFDSFAANGQIISARDFFSLGSSSGADFKIAPEGTAITARVAFPSAHSSYAMKCFLFGYQTPITLG